MLIHTTINHPGHTAFIMWSHAYNRGDRNAKVPVRLTYARRSVWDRGLVNGN